MHVLAVLITAIAKQSIAVINHQLILKIYSPPTNAISWSYINVINNDYAENPFGCKYAINTPISQWPKKQGEKMCWYHYLINPDVTNYFKSKINESYFEEFGYVNFISSTIARWAFSKPTQIWRDIISINEKRIFGNKCETNVADIALIMRTWRDIAEHDSQQEIWKHNITEIFDYSGGHCILQSALNKIKMMNNTSICIFVTSDNINVTKTLVEKLEEKNIPLVHIVYNDYDDSDWHSGKLIEDSKSSIGIPIKIFLKTN